LKTKALTHSEGWIMSAVHRRTALLLSLGFMTGCASAEDRLSQGVELQAQGRYMEAVYRYADAVEKDPSLAEAQGRLLVAGDSALFQAMDDADAYERRGDPVAAAGRYREIDQMLARIRSVGLRLRPPADYTDIRRGVFDRAIEWQMIEGYEAQDQGRWEDARRSFIGARGDYLPSREQVEESLEAETQLLLAWSHVELEDHRPRAGYAIAQQALEVRQSPAREVVTQVRDLHHRALDMGTVVVAVLPVTASGGVRGYLGPEFEIQLDEDLTRDHWNQPPLFVQVADPLILRQELRGLLRGRVPQSALLVGRALDLIGADVGVMVEVTTLDVVEEDVEYRSRTARTLPQGRGVNRGTVDTVTYQVATGEVSYHVEAVGILVDVEGREIASFTAAAQQGGPFERGEYDGDPESLDLGSIEARLFDPEVQAGERRHIEQALLEELALNIAAGTYETVLAGVR
jgi:tetratricopeptide (TPR) repeat protein